LLAEIIGEEVENWRANVMPEILRKMRKGRVGAT